MKKILAVLLVGVLIFSGCNLFKKSAQEAVNEGIAEFGAVKKMSSQLVIKGLVQSPQGETPSKIEFTVDATGMSDVSNEQSPKINTDLKITAKFDDQAGSGQLTFRTVENKIYANLVALELPGMEEAMRTELSNVLNTWWKMPTGENNPISQLSEERKKLQEHFKNTRFFTNAMEDGTGDVRGMPATRYRVNLDKEELKKFVMDLARSSENALDPEETKAIEDSLKNIEFSGVVWVGDDSIVHRIIGTLTIISEVEGPNSSFEIDYTAWDFGKDVEVTAPDSAKDFNPLLLSLFGALGSMADGTSTEVDDSPLGELQLGTETEAQQ